MLVSNLQQFIRLLVPPLAAAGINQASQKNVTASLEAMAAALEPFKELDAEQLTDLLRVAREYRQSGQIPDWVVSKKGPGNPKPPKAPKLTPAEAVSRLRALHHRAHELDPSEVAREVQGLSGLSVKELQEVQREFLGASVGKKKEELLASLQKRIDDARASRERVGGILAH